MDLKKFGYLTKETFDKVIEWGFGRKSKNNAQEISEATKRAFVKINHNDLSGAARELITLKK